MALPFETHGAPHGARAVAILARTLHKELRQGGFSDRDVIALAGELVAAVTIDVQGRKGRGDA